MISLGIISVQEKVKKGIFTRTPIEIKKFSHADVPIIVANVFCGKEYFLKNRLLKNRAFRILKRSGAQFICMEEDEEKNLCRGICKSELNDAVSYALKYITGNPTGKTVWFSDISGENIDIKILYFVSRKVQHLGLRTQNVLKSEMLAEELCEEYGINLEIQDENFLIPGYVSMVVDYDTKIIKMGHDFLIDGRELSFDLQGYHIDIPSLLTKCPDFSQKLVHKAWLFGKKRLTR